MYCRVKGQNGRIVEAPRSADPNTNYEENVFYQVLRGHGMVFSISDELMNCEKTNDMGQITDDYKLKMNILKEFPDVVSDSEYIKNNNVKIQGEPVLAQGVKGRVIKSQAELDMLKKRGLVIDVANSEEVVEQPERPAEPIMVTLPKEEKVSTVEAPVAEVVDQEAPVMNIADLNIDMLKTEILAVADSKNIELTTAERELPKVKLIQVINEKVKK